MTKINTELSVIIPYHYDDDTLGEQLAALGKQVWSGNWEVVIADNGSDEGLGRLVEAYRNDLPQVRVVDASDHPGAAHARNIGVAAAAGEKILFTDADDVVAPGWLAAMASALEQHDFVACRMDFEKLNPPLASLGRKAHQQTEPQSYTYPDFLPHAAGTSIGIKRSVHNAVGGFDEAMLKLQDTDYCWRLQLQGIPLVFVPEAVVYYRLRGGLRDLLKQAYGYGAYNVELYTRYRHKGMPQLTWKRGAFGWYSLLRRTPQLLNESTRSFWLWDLAFRLGRVKGSIRCGVFAL